MRRLSSILIFTTFLLTSCQDNKSNFDYDPTVPYPLLNTGDFWTDKFDQRGLQNAIVNRDKLYCNTIDVGGDRNFLYCLNLKNGLVIWRGHVNEYASQPVSFFKDLVVYSSYLGDISTFDNTGINIWNAKFNHPYGGHWLDTINARLLVKTIYWKNVSQYDVKSGKLISDTESDSLQQLIGSRMKDRRPFEEHEYQFMRAGKTYTITCRPSKPDEVGEYTIKIAMLNR